MRCFFLVLCFVVSAVGAEWSAFVPPVAGEGSVDGFVEEKLEEAGLGMSEAADRHTLVRRVFLVMLGMPPSPEDVAAFLDDGGSDDEAWGRLVERVLADSRYGERWAQHWLDVIRWAETVGFETNAQRRSAWHYRDWVIGTFNSDMPYDRFVFEQIAGDTVGVDAALGFLVAGPANLPGQIGRDEEAMRQARQDELDEVIRTVSQAFLGLTVACARCHDHKFDPISEKDYYAMQAIFSGLRYGDRRLRGKQDEEWAVKVPGLRKRLVGLEAELEALRVRLGLRAALVDVQEERFEGVEVESVRMRIANSRGNAQASLYEFEVWSSAGENVALGAASSASSFALENQTRHPDCLNDGSVDKRQAFPWRAKSAGAAWVRIDLVEPVAVDRVVWHAGFSVPVDYVIEVRAAGSDEWVEVAHTRDRLPRVDDGRGADAMVIAGVGSADVERLVGLLGEIRKLHGEVARFSAGPRVYAASFVEGPPVTRVLRRGDPMQVGDVVEPGVPAVLGRLDFKSDAPESARRVALARHLIDPEHALTARVLVNRVWQHHFGTGLVATPSDFGEMGGAPSHPELLDWLAVRFVEEGWSMKALHRVILKSRTFRQANAPRADGLAVDAGARLLWRFPPRRVEAEVIRDAILATSGKLNPKAGGVGFDFFAQQGGLADYKPHETFKEDGWRRMIYARKIRMQAVDIFGSFDCPDAGQMKPMRTRSITPVQSLSLMNSPFVSRQAGFFAERLRAEAGDELVDQVQLAIQLAFSRPEVEEEVVALAVLAHEHGLEHVCRVLFNASEFIYLP